MADDDEPPIADSGTVARVVDALAGGKWALGRDRDIAAYIRQRFPGAAEAVHIAHGFHRRAALWAVTQCIPPATGVIFASSGLPAPSGFLYSWAAQASPDARFLYVNEDPKITEIIRGALGQREPRVGAATACARCPAQVLSTPQARELLARGPVSLHIVNAAHRWPAGIARETVAGYAELLPPGSSLCLSAGSPARDPATGEITPRAQELLEVLRLAGGPVYPHRPEDVASWIKGAKLVLHPAGVTDARRFGRPAPRGPLRDYPATVLEAVALRP